MSHEDGLYHPLNRHHEMNMWFAFLAGSIASSCLSFFKISTKGDDVLVKHQSYFNPFSVTHTRLTMVPSEIDRFRAH